MQYCVFIHTNEKQMVGALVAKYALKRNSTHGEEFDVRIIRTEGFSFMADREGQQYLRDGVMRPWLNDDLQSFTPLRFMPPELMDYQGRALVIDPDVFAIQDVWELLTRDMQNHAILCRMRAGPKGFVDRCKASSVMLLDCSRLTHWQVEQQFGEMFDGQRDYQPWVCLKLEPEKSIGFFENEWNDFDQLTEKTRMLHTTRRRTQPWKTGLPVDWRPADRFRLFPPFGWLMRARRHFFGEYGLLGHYKAHPDKNQELLFFQLLAECVDKDIISESMLQQEIQLGHVRQDTFEVLKKVSRGA